MLFQNLMKQEISFFEENKPGCVQYIQEIIDSEDLNDFLSKRPHKIKSSGSFLTAALCLSSYRKLDIATGLRH